MSEQTNILKTVVAPMLNANEDEISIVDVCVKNGDAVSAGQVLFVVESTKTTSDVLCENGGYAREINVATDDQVPVGAELCVIADSLDGEIIREVAAPVATRTAATQTAVAIPPAAGTTNKPSTAKATQPALQLATQHGVDLDRLGLDRIVTSKDVLAACKIANTLSPQSPLTKSIPIHANAAAAKLVILGGGSHARALIELIRASRPDMQIVAAVDDGKDPAADVMGVPIIGDSNELPRLLEQGVRYAAMGVGAVTNPQLRKRLFDRLAGYGFELPSFIHPRATVESSATMGVGNQIFAGAIVGTLVAIGNNTLINCGCVLSHDCRIGSHSHIAPGAILAGGVTVGENSTVGMGCTVYLGKSIGDGVIVGNGVHVFDSVDDGQFVRPRKQLGRVA